MGCLVICADDRGRTCMSVATVQTFNLDLLMYLVLCLHVSLLNTICLLYICTHEDDIAYCGIMLYKIINITHYSSDEGRL